MQNAKYLGYTAIVAAVLLDLYAGNPNGDAAFRMMMDWLALFLGVVGLGGLAAGPVGAWRR
ncbi:MAG: hypothetical protein JNM81_14325 [Rhodospirillaceae bacterium]|nr:hypothetical protein [Rhodospirillaceae bacterium]